MQERLRWLPDSHRARRAAFAGDPLRLVQGSLDLSAPCQLTGKTIRCLPRWGMPAFLAERRRGIVFAWSTA
jgi:hypothetical protein